VNSGNRTIIFGGLSTGANTVSGPIINGTSVLSVQKADTGTWAITHPANTYTGTTTINAGKLILAGSLTSDLITNTATLAPQGTPATTGSLSLVSPSIYQIRATPSGTDQLTVAGTVTLAGALDLIAEPGLSDGTYTILNKTSAGAVTGIFTGKPEGSVFTAGGYDWQISYTGGDGNDVVITLQTQSGSSMLAMSEINSVSPSESIDTNNDGESDLLEYATGQDPNAATLAQSGMSVLAGQMQFTYTRSKAAFDEGYLFDVQYSDTLTPDSWTSAGPGSVILEASTQTVRALIPAGTTGQRFIRIKVSAPEQTVENSGR
jgi:autotransporter-associated beta strand protein